METGNLTDLTDLTDLSAGRLYAPDGRERVMAPTAAHSCILPVFYRRAAIPSAQHLQ
jgi:hypothetical protein